VSNFSGNQGSLSAQDLGGEFNALRYLALSLLSEMETATLVKVISCSNNGGLSPVGTVQVQPLVNLKDGHDQPVEHPQLYGIPYFRLQGGSNAVIMDPEKGDIGIAVFASRDISSVKTLKGLATAASDRKYDLADGLYIGGVLNGSPTQYVQFNSAGITVNSPAKVHVVAPDVTVDASTSATVNTATADVSATSALNVTSPTSTFNGDVTITGLLAGQGGMAITGGTGATITGNLVQTGGNLTSNGTNLHTHTHPDPQGGNTGVPN